MFTLKLKTIAAAVAIAVVSMAVPSTGKATTVTFSQDADTTFGNILSTMEVLALVNITAPAGTFVNLQTVLDAITSGAEFITNIYFGPNQDAWSNPTLNAQNANAGGTLATANPTSALWLAVNFGDIDFQNGLTVEFGESFSLNFGDAFIKEDPVVFDTPSSPPPPSPIPLPAAGWLLITALGGLALAARRRRTA